MNLQSLRERKLNLRFISGRHLNLQFLRRRQLNLRIVRGWHLNLRFFKVRQLNCRIFRARPVPDPGTRGRDTGSRTRDPVHIVTARVLLTGSKLRLMSWLLGKDLQRSVRKDHHPKRQKLRRAGLLRHSKW